MDAVTLSVVQSITGIHLHSWDSVLSESGIRWALGSGPASHAFFVIPGGSATLASIVDGDGPYLYTPSLHPCFVSVAYIE